MLAAERDDARFGRSFAAPLVGLALGTGLRLGELLALPWGPDGVDLDGRVVRVRRSLDRHLRDGGYPFVPPKSKASRRDVPLMDVDVQRLRRHRLATGRPGYSALVFHDNGRPVAPHRLPRALWRRLLHGTRKADGTEKTPPLVALAAPLPRVHDLRHTFAPHALAASSATRTPRSCSPATGTRCTARSPLRPRRSSVGTRLTHAATLPRKPLQTAARPLVAKNQGCRFESCLPCCGRPRVSGAWSAARA